MQTSISPTSPLAGLPSFTLNAPTNAASTASFAQQLAAALENYLGASGGASSLQVNIQSTGSQTSGSRQFVVTLMDTEPTQPAGAPQQNLVASNPAASGTVTLMNLSGSPAVVAAVPSTPAAPSISLAPPATEQDAYWAMQPPEVQALRNISDETDRGVLAKQLADKGFLIDVPIMVWHWDPLITMTIRQNSGYTWVPSGDQAALPTCPNCDVPGLAHYDPDNPPANSITVSTAWAKGLESTAPWHMG